MSVYDDVKKALQDFLAPDISEIKGEVKSISARIEALDKTTEVRFRAIEDKLTTRFDGVDRRFDDLLERLELKKRIESLEREREERKSN